MKFPAYFGRLLGLADDKESKDQFAVSLVPTSDLEREDP